MTRRTLADRVVIIIAGLTILAGAGQAIAPEAALSAMGAQASPTDIYLFRSLSVAVALFGGLLLHAALRGTRMLLPYLWTALQKLSGAALLLWAVLSGLTESIALAVVIYDGLCGIFLLWYGNAIRTGTGGTS